MARPTVVFLDARPDTDLSVEAAILDAAGYDLVKGNAFTAEAMSAAGRDAEGIIVQYAKLSAAVIANLSRCRVIVRYGIGLDNVDLAAASARRIPVAYVPDYCIEEVSNHALLLVLALARKLPVVTEAARSGRSSFADVLPFLSGIRRLHGETLGTLGFGRIARRLAVKAQALGMQVVTYDPYVSADAFAQAGVQGLSLEEVLRKSDFLSLHLPATPETRHIINAQSLGLMQPTAFVINTARGPLVDEAALAAALDAGRLGGAGLDVFEQEPLAQDHPLQGRSNVILTPHVAFHSDAAMLELRQRVAQEAVQVLSGGWPTPARFANPQVAR